MNTEILLEAARGITLFVSHLTARSCAWLGICALLHLVIPAALPRGTNSFVQRQDLADFAIVTHEGKIDRFKKRYSPEKFKEFLIQS
jgi:hypothetical protein